MKIKCFAVILLVSIVCSSCISVRPVNTSTKANVEQQIQLGDKLVIDDIMEVTIDYIYLTEEKTFPPSGNYHYLVFGLNDVKDEKYLIVTGNVKCIAGKALNINSCVDGDIIINDKYEQGLSITLGEQFDENVKSLQTRRFYLYASISDELAGIIETVKLNLKLLSDEKYIDTSFLLIPGNASRQGFILEAGVNDFKEEPASKD